jgi:hypothetical protein
MPTQITDGFVVTGARLADAEFELAGDGWAVPLTAKSRSDTAAEVVWSQATIAALPAGTNKGSYELVATNHAGSALTGVSLLLPDYSGDDLVSRINTEATTAFVSTVMPPELMARIAALEAASAKAIYPDMGVFAQYRADGAYTLDDTRQNMTMNFDTKEVDANNAVTVGTDAAHPWIFKVPAGRGGLYHVTTQITFTDPAGALDVGLELMKNGADYHKRMWRGTVNPGYSAAVGSVDVEATDGDTIAIKLWMNDNPTTGAILTTEDSWVQVHRVLGY